MNREKLKNLGSMGIKATIAIAFFSVSADILAVILPPVSKKISRRIKEELLLVQAWNKSPDLGYNLQMRLDRERARRKS